MRFFLLLSSFLAASLLFSACSGSRVLQYSAADTFCHTSDKAIRFDSLTFANLEDKDTAGYEELLREKFSPRSIRAAKNFRLYGLLGKYFRTEDLHEKLRLRLRINNIVSVHEFGISDFAATMQCEKTRIMETFEYLEAWKSKNLARATVASIIAGGIAGTLASTLNLAGADNTIEQGVNITGAILGTYLGFKSFKVNKKIRLSHPQNELREIWEKPANSKYMPAVVYSFLTSPFKYENSYITGLDFIIEDWRKKGLLDDAKTLKIIMSDGGDYDSDALEVRLQMLDTFDEEIRIMQYDLKRLLQELLISEKN
jgi:hypothetical protein